MTQNFFLSHSLCLYSHNSDEHIFNIAWFLDGMTTQSDTLWYWESISVFLHVMHLLDAIYLHWFKLKEKKTTDLQFSTSGSWFYYSIFHDFKNRLPWKYPSTLGITRTTRFSWIIRTTFDREKTKRFSFCFQAIFCFISIINSISIHLGRIFLFFIKKNRGKSFAIEKNRGKSPIEKQKHYREEKNC